MNSIIFGVGFAAAAGFGEYAYVQPYLGHGYQAMKSASATCNNVNMLNHNIAPDVRGITCPVLAALIKNGDLVVNADGKLTKEATRQAFIDALIPENIATGTTNNNFRSDECPDCPVAIDPFNMNVIPTPFRRVAAPANGPQEHFRSTGIRDTPNADGTVTSEAHFNAVAGHCNPGDEPWTLDLNSCISKSFDCSILSGASCKSPFFSNDENARCHSTTTTACLTAMHDAIQQMFQVFSEDGTLTSEIPAKEYKDLWLKGIYPSGYVARRANFCAKSMPMKSLNMHQKYLNTMRSLNMPMRSLNMHKGYPWSLNMYKGLY